MLLSGEPSTGKSRLTAALMERLTTEPHTRLRYFCSPQHTDSAFFPIIGQTERAAGFTHADTAQVKLDKLDAVPVAVSAVTLGGIRTILGVPLLSKGEMIGAFFLSRQEVRPFTNKQIELVQSFAAQAVIAIGTRDCSTSFVSAPQTLLRPWNNRRPRLTCSR